jgi:NAD+--dinitrogen-reductase ADP-D-ribosyltransferase
MRPGDIQRLRTPPAELRKPLVKVFFYRQLFPPGILKGEDEFMAIGGVYRVKTVL